MKHGRPLARTGGVKQLLLSAAVLAAALVAVSPQAQAAQTDPRATALITASGKAIGVEALSKYRTMQTEASVDALGLKGTAVQYVDLRAGRMSETISVGPYVQGDGYDGKVAWNADRTQLVWDVGSDGDRASAIDNAYNASYGLWKPNAAGAMVAWAGTKSVAGKQYDVLDVRPPGVKVPFQMFFDRTTHLPARSETHNGFVTSAVALDEYRSVRGVRVPMRVHEIGSDGNEAVLRVTNVAFDAPGTLAKVARPQTRPTDFSMAGGKTSTTVPIALGENHVYLDVMLNGKGPYRFIFDTGGQNVIDPSVAKEIGAIGSGSAQGSGVGSQTESISFAMLQTLQVGDALLKDQLFAIAPTREGFGMSAGRPVDGLIGWEVLARYVTTFDYANKRVVLSLPGTASAPANASVVPFLLYSTQPQVPCKVDGISSVCTIDTGARDTISFMTPFLNDHPQIVPAALTAPGVNGFGFGGPSIGKLGRVQSVEIGGFSMPDLIADYSLQTSGAMSAPFIAANVGGNLLRRFTVTFDYGKQTMALAPNAAFAERDTYERSGLFLIQRQGKVLVIDARPGTPAADAGIAKGDALVSVDGTAVSTMSLQEIRDVFVRPAGTIVKLEVAGKDGTTRTVSLTLRDYV